jgi:hypothetical protein
LALKELGVNDITAVTTRTCHLSDYGRRNIDNLARHVRTVELVPNQTVRKTLNRLGVELVGDISWPEHIAIHRAPFQYALESGKKLIVYGENPLNQYGSPPGMEDARQMTQRWVSEFGGFLGLRPEDLVGMGGIKVSDIRDYQAPSDADLKDAGVGAIFLGQFIPWDSHRNAELARVHGMSVPGDPPALANWWVEENLDNYQTGLHDYGLYLKYGYTRGTAQASVDMRSGRITREQGLQIAERCEANATPYKYLDLLADDILEPIGLNFNKFMETMQGFARAA